MSRGNSVSCVYHAKPPQLLQVLGHIGEGETGAPSKRLNRALALPQMLDEFQPVFMAKAAGQRGEVAVKQAFWRGA